LNKCSKGAFFRSLGRREFFTLIAKFGFSVGALTKGGTVLASKMKEPLGDENHLDIVLPGRLGSPTMTMFEDPRLDPRIIKELTTNTLPPASMPPEITLSSSYESAIEWIEFMHEAMRANDAVFLKSMPEFSDVESTELSIESDSSHKIKLFIDKPLKPDTSMPCIVHMHGGGMTFDTAESPQNIRWRKSLAQQGMLVVGVEFLSEALFPGHHPFPAGLNDCARAVRWAHDNRDKLGVSSIIVLGESGGGNLAIASAIKANKEGWIDNIDGVYAMAPMIFGFYGTPPPNLMSWRENLDYMGSHAMMRAMRMVYDPNRENHENPLAYPFVAKENELRGLPPHIIVNYELDLIRDEGVAFAQRLRKSGVDATSMIINGSTHCNEIAMPDVMPELTRDRLMSIAAFARGVKSKN
jgi:acetyl esterase/lipase